MSQTITPDGKSITFNKENNTCMLLLEALHRLRTEMDCVLPSVIAFDVLDTGTHMKVTFKRLSAEDIQYVCNYINLNQI